MIKTITFRERENPLDVFGSSPELYRKKNDNSELNEKEFNERRLTLESYPVFLNIDATSICQLRCPLCPNAPDMKDVLRVK